jgi:hypothetical protein
MSETLHMWAVAPAAIGTCCLAADRARVRPPEIVASVVMLVAMLDAGLLGLVAPVYWAAVLLIAALALAAWRRPRQRRTPRVPTTMTLHTALGLVMMAALQVAMGTHPPTSAHTHGVGLGPLLLAAVIGYGIASVLLLRRMPARLDRAQIGAMAASIVLMSIAGL